jgi:ubiquinone/menaquinone biosynthesis C-methylase UbiE
MRLVNKYFMACSGSKLLDIGCNDGIYTKKYCEYFGIEFENAYGVDYNENNVKILPQERFKHHDIDLLISLPYENQEFDLIVMNQVLEHTKNISHIISEINRISKKGALFAVSVPNLAALHSRFFLLFGKMPLAIQGMDAHVRGFTIKALKRYIEKYGFEYIDYTGSGMYPFVGSVTGLLGRVFPKFSVFFTLLFKKIEDCDISKLSVKQFHETKINF